MIRRKAPEPEQEETTSVLQTALHMADAVEYLRRVAEKAGLQKVAIQLAGVRRNLLKTAVSESHDESKSC